MNQGKNVIKIYCDCRFYNLVNTYTIQPTPIQAGGFNRLFGYSD